MRQAVPGWSVIRMRQATTNARPRRPIAEKDARHPYSKAISPTLGPAKALPSGCPAKVMPIMVPVGWRPRR